MSNRSNFESRRGPGKRRDFEEQESVAEKKEEIQKKALMDGKYTYYLVSAAEEVRERWRGEDLSPEEEDEVLEEIEEEYKEKLDEEGILGETVREDFGKELKKVALNKTGGSIDIGSWVQIRTNRVEGNKLGFLDREQYFNTVEHLREEVEKSNPEWKLHLDQSTYGKSEDEVGFSKHTEGFGRAALKEGDLRTAAKSYKEADISQDSSFFKELESEIERAKDSQDEDLKKGAEAAVEILKTQT